MTQVLELLDKEIKVAMINTLRALLEKVDTMQKQMDIVDKEMQS